MSRFSRRQLLRGAGVALALPWLETFAPRTARAQAAATAKRRRYVSMSWPHGVIPYYWPTTPGTGDAWQLAPLMEPLAPIKAKVAVLGGVSNHSTWNGHIEPAHGHVCAATWTCTKANGPSNGYSGTSVDQVIARTIGQETALSSLQVGLSTLDSYPDGLPGQHSRSISWSDPQTPLYKIISPQAVFDRLIGGATSSNMTATPDAAAERRRLLRKSALDYLIESTTSLKLRVSRGDGVRLDRFLGSVRALEQRVATPAMQLTCQRMARPTEVYAVGQSNAGTITEGYVGDKPPEGYDRGHHADLMIDLVAMALQCDTTRVVSFMLDDERSDFSYNFLPGYRFTATSARPDPTLIIGGLHGLQHTSADSDAWRTIIRWWMEKAARLAQKLDAIREDDGSSVLDNTVIMSASSMNGLNHDTQDLPIVLLGSGGGVLKQNVYQRWPAEKPPNLADLHLMLMQKVYGCPDTTFGAKVGSFADPSIPQPTELLA